MSPRVVMPWIGFAIAALAFALHFVWPPAAGIAVLGPLVASVGVMMLNRVRSRIILYVATLLYAAALGHASGSPLLGAAGAAAFLFAMPTETLTRSFGYRAGWVCTVGFVLAVGLAAAAWPVGSWIWGLAPGLAFAGLGAFMNTSGLLDMRKQHRAAWGVKMGQPVPDFTLKDRSGSTTFRLADHRGKYVLISLLRGDWCPLCQVKMRIYQREAQNLAKLNITLAVISPTTGADSVAFAKDAGLDLMLLADPENVVAKLFDAVYPKSAKGQDGPIPSSFLLDREGRLMHCSRPDDFESFLDPAQLGRLLEKGAPAVAV
jgi:peroxiredoxin